MLEILKDFIYGSIVSCLILSVCILGCFVILYFTSTYIIYVKILLCSVYIISYIVGVVYAVINYMYR